MTKTEAIKHIRHAMKEAVDSQIYFDSKGSIELGWRMYTYHNGLYTALDIVEQIESLK